MSGLGEGVALGSDVAFQSAIDSFGSDASQSISRAGTQFSNIFKTFQATGAAPSSGGIIQSISDAFSSLSGKLGVDFGSSGSIPEKSNLFSTGTQTPRISSSINPNLVIGAGATLATTATVYSLAINPGVQQTAQSFSGAAKSISDAIKISAQTGQSILTSQYGPILLIGGLALAAVLVLKK